MVDLALPNIFVAMGGEVDQDRQQRIQQFQLSLAQLLAVIVCIALGITCLRLSVHPRFIGGSVPNINLIVIGLAMFVVIPAFSIFSRASWTPLAKLLGAMALSILIAFEILAFVLLSGLI